MDQRLEIELVRHLELAYAAGSNPFMPAHASPYQWANACHDLWQAGRIDVAEYAARLLSREFPDLTYLTNMVELFDAMPHDMAAPMAFCDDVAADVQVVRRPGCNVTLLCFCAQAGTLGHPINFAHQWLGRLPVNLVYLKDSRDVSGGCGYPSLGPDRTSSVAALRHLLGKLDTSRLYALGVSYGGYAALYYGLDLRAYGVLTLGAQTDLTAEFNERVGFSPALPAILREAPDYAQNLRQLYMCADHHPGVLICFSAGQMYDRQHAERMRGVPNAELVPVENHSHHNVIDPLIRRGRLFDLLHRLLSLDPAR